MAVDWNFVAVCRKDMKALSRRSEGREITASRGSVNIALTMHSDTDEARFRINEAALVDAIAMIEKVKARLDCAPPRAEGILSLRGVIEHIDEAHEDEARKVLHDALLKSFTEALSSLAAARKSEGASMSDVLSDELSNIEQLTKDASGLAAVAPQAIKRE